MTNRRRTLIATSSATLLLAGLLVGCGSSDDGGSVEDFCSDNAALTESSMFTDLSSDDPNSAKEAFASTLDKIEKINAPADVKDDWNVLVSAIRDMSEGIQDLDLSSEEGSAAIEELMEKMTSEETVAASENLDTFMTENCES